MAHLRRQRAPRAPIPPTEPVTCRYCQSLAQCCSAALIFPHRPDLADKRYWRCERCDARVGCHPGTDIPLGHLANRTLRTLRSQAHSVFDPIWKERQELSRGQAYRWLARALGLDFADTHIGQFDESLCRATIALCTQRLQGEGMPMQAVIDSEFHDQVIVVTDRGAANDVSVTNDAEAVVRAVTDSFGPWPIIYRDSQGFYDQLLHEGGRFTGFRLLRASHLNQALAAINDAPVLEP